jgi:hypothetical protein
MNDVRQSCYVNLKTLNNGDLEITPTAQAVEEAERFLAMSPMQALEELFEDWLCNGWEFIAPEKIGALTDSPILTDEILYNDQGNIEYIGSIWWFPNYQVENEIETLLKESKVVFSLAKEAK